MEDLESTDSQKIIPFKLCFTNKHLFGKSNVRIGKPLNLPPIITEKFYTKNNENYVDNLQKFIDKLTVDEPKKKYNKPITENQKYGWYHDIVLYESAPKELNHHKHTNVLIVEHLMNYAKIRT